MVLPQPLVFGTLVRRYKRFLADVQLSDGRVVVAHTANPGSMKTCAEPGSRVWLSAQPNPRRKLGYTWEVIEVADGRVYVNPVATNRLVVEAIKQGRIDELRGYSIVEREVRVGDRSRIDVRLRGSGGRDCYIEIKSATLHVGEGRIAFPDAVTERGRRHLGDLMRLRHGGERAVLFYSVNRTDARSMEVADDIDREYGRALRAALRAGVEVLSYRIAIEPSGISVDRAIPFVA